MMICESGERRIPVHSAGRALRWFEVVTGCRTFPEHQLVAARGASAWQPNNCMRPESLPSHGAKLCIPPLVMMWQPSRTENVVLRTCEVISPNPSMPRLPRSWAFTSERIRIIEARRSSRRWWLGRSVHRIFLSRYGR